ncbi:MAG: hypothetical protein K0R14_2010 [Burkholderiales bacterium]|jgi:hypothetical protein|nr:hypothetical protein [Burkholderiales bacterium]
MRKKHLIKPLFSTAIFIGLSVAAHAETFTFFAQVVNNTDLPLKNVTMSVTPDGYKLSSSKVLNIPELPPNGLNLSDTYDSNNAINTTNAHGSYYWAKTVENFSTPTEGYVTVETDGNLTIEEWGLRFTYGTYAGEPIVYSVDTSSGKQACRIIFNDRRQFSAVFIEAGNNISPSTDGRARYTNQLRARVQPYNSGKCDIPLVIRWTANQLAALKAGQK